MSLPLSMLICVSVVQLCLGQSPVNETITARQVPLLGGWHKLKANSTEVEEAAIYAEKTFNLKSETQHLYRIVNVTSAESQVTNVVNFRIKGILKKTKCSKSDNRDLKTCELSKKFKVCLFKMTYDPRKSKYEMQGHKCRKDKNTKDSA